MSRKLWIAVAVLGTVASSFAQEGRPRIDVEHYVINAEINPNTQSLAGTASVRFTTQEDRISSVVFELHNALNVSKVEDESGRELGASRSRNDFTVRVAFPEALEKGKTVTLTFRYDGVLTGKEESPVYGVRFASIQSDHSYLLYPARWFPVSGYTEDRYTAEIKVTVPAGNKVIAGGSEQVAQVTGGKLAYTFTTRQPAFPGSIAVVQGDPLRIASEGVTSDLYFRDAAREMAGPYGQEAGKVMTYLTSVFGLPPQANLTFVQTENGAPNGYATTGVIFLSPRSIGDKVNSRLLANQIARQWWGTLLSAESRNHLWITNGAARYAELLYVAQANGPAAMENEVRETYIEALTVDSPPLIQVSRVEDYSPEFWALTAGKGAAVYHMLRSVIGDEKFFQLLKQLPEKHAWQSVNTGDLRKAAEELTATNLQYFFIQWIESTGAPEFKSEYTIFRTQKGFRVMGKVTQDLDTFRMPVDLKIETEGNPEEKRIEVVGTSSEFIVETFGKPKSVTLDPNNRVLRFSNPIRVAVAIRRGEQFVEVGEFGDALKEYSKALEVDRNNSLAQYRVGEVFFKQSNYQSAANAFREALNGSLDPAWVEVWSHLNLGMIFDITGQRERAVNEYKLAVRTKDNTQGAQEIAAKYINEPYQRKGADDR